MVSSPLDIKAALYKEFKDRLRAQKVRDDFTEQNELKNKSLN
jgi:hypothetical protein